MASTKREFATYMFFQTAVTTGLLSVACTRLALTFRFHVVDVLMLLFGGISLIVTIMTLGLEP